MKKIIALAIYVVLALVVAAYAEQHSARSAPAEVPSHTASR